MSLKVSDVLNELDGEGIIWTDSDNTGEELAKMGLEHDSLIISSTEIGILKNALVALQVLASNNADEFLENLAENCLEILGE